MNLGLKCQQISFSGVDMICVQLERISGRGKRHLDGVTSAKKIDMLHHKAE